MPRSTRAAGAGARRSSCARTPASPSSEPLSPAERRVLLQLIGGQSEKRIAAALSLTPGTAHQYAVEVYRKLGVPGRSVLSALWLRG